MHGRDDYVAIMAHHVAKSRFWRFRREARVTKMPIFMYQKNLLNLARPVPELFQKYI